MINKNSVSARFSTFLTKKVEKVEKGDWKNLPKYNFKLKTTVGCIHACTWMIISSYFETKQKDLFQALVCFFNFSWFSFLKTHTFQGYFFIIFISFTKNKILFWQISFNSDDIEFLKFELQYQEINQSWDNRVVTTLTSKVRFFRSIYFWSIYQLM